MATTKKRKRNGVGRGPAKPTRMMKLFKVPPGMDFSSIVIRELDGTDELEAAIWADKNQNSALSDSVKAAFQGEQRECIRLSIVQVDGKAVNTNGLPFMAMDGWSFRSLRYLKEFFADLNGVEYDDVKNAVAGAEILTTPASLMDEDDDDENDEDQPIGE